MFDGCWQDPTRREIDVGLGACGIIQSCLAKRIVPMGAATIHADIVSMGMCRALGIQPLVENLGGRALKR